MSPPTTEAGPESPESAAARALPATARAAILAAPTAIRMEDVPLPEPGPGQILVRLEGCGVCGSNIPVWEGRSWFEYPLEPGAPGHEGWGRVVAVGPDSEESPGDSPGDSAAAKSAVESPAVSRREPSEAASDRAPEFAPGDRVALLSQHAFAEYDVADADAAVRLPDALGDAPFPGEALGCAMNVFRRSGISAGDRVAVIGIGFLGALVTQLAANAGARVLAISRRPFALEIGRTMGAEETLALGGSTEGRGAHDGDDGSPSTSYSVDAMVERVGELTGGELFDVVVEATGHQEPLDLAGKLTRVRGRLVIAGFHQDGRREVDLQLWNWRGLDVINAHERETEVYVRGIREAAEAVADGRLDPGPLYTHTYPLDRLDEALEAARTRPDGFLKALVTP